MEQKSGYLYVPCPPKYGCKIYTVNIKKTSFSNRLYEDVRDEGVTKSANQFIHSKATFQASHEKSVKTMNLQVQGVFLTRTPPKSSKYKKVNMTAPQ